MAATVFSTQLQKLRKAKGVKQEQLAEHLGVSTQAVSKWENGSYPDGDLLPRIARFFDVSIDYLYGNEQETMRFDERVVEFMDKGNDEKSSRYEKMLELQWMAHGNGTQPNGYLPLLKVAKNEGRTGSGYISRNGMSFMRLSEDLRYGFVMERPQEGYESYLSETKVLAELFELLGDEDAINVLMFMMTLDSTELVRAETVASYLQISLEKVDKVLKKAIGFGHSTLFGGGAQGLISSSTLLKEDGTEEYLYTVQSYLIVNLLRLLVVAKDVLYPIHSYRNLSVDISKPLLDRKSLLELLMKNKTEEEHYE